MSGRACFRVHIYFIVYTDLCASVHGCICLYVCERVLVSIMNGVSVFDRALLGEGLKMSLWDSKSLHNIVSAKHARFCH